MCGDDGCCWSIKFNCQIVFLDLSHNTVREESKYMVSVLSFMTVHCVDLLFFKSADSLWSGGSGLLCHVVSCWPGHAVLGAPYWKTGSIGLWCLTCLSEDSSGLIYNALMDRTTGKHVFWWGSTRALPFIMAGYRLSRQTYDVAAWL